MQYYYHEQLTDLDDTGFGIIFEEKPNPYMPLHWHRAVELLLIVRGRTTCKFSYTTIDARPGELYLINSHDVHETHCSSDAVYLCIHILPNLMCQYVPNFDQLSFSLKFDAEDVSKAEAYQKLKMHMEEILRLTREEPYGYRLERHKHLFGAAAILVKNFSQPLAVEEKQLSLFWNTPSSITPRN